MLQVFAICPYFYEAECLTEAKLAFYSRHDFRREYICLFTCIFQER